MLMIIAWNSKGKKKQEKSDSLASNWDRSLTNRHGRLKLDMNKCQNMRFQELFSEFDYLFSFSNDAVIFRSSRDETYCSRVLRDSICHFLVRPSVRPFKVFPTIPWSFKLSLLVCLFICLPDFFWKYRRRRCCSNVPKWARPDRILYMPEGR